MLIDVLLVCRCVGVGWVLVGFEFLVVCLIYLMGLLWVVGCFLVLGWF